MIKTEKDSTFVSVLGYALGGQLPLLPGSSDEWNRLYTLSQRHRLQAVVCDTLYDTPEFKQLDPEIKNRFISDSKAIVAWQSRKSLDFSSIYRLLRESGAKPLVLKGLACRVLWKNPDARPSGDEDIFVDREDFEKCLRVLSENGYRISPKSPDTACVSPDSGLIIELHSSLFPEDSPYFSRFNGYFNNIFESCFTFSAYGTEFIIPDPTLSILYLILHALKHFIHSGVGIRQLCDISLFAKAYGKNADWEKIKIAMNELGAFKWYSAVMTILSDRLMLDPETAGIPEEHFSEAEDICPLLDDITSGAVFGAYDMARHHSGNITLETVEHGKNRCTLIHTVFPPRSKLHLRYKYLDKYPFLLPAAWISRMVKYRKQSKKSGQSISRSLKIGKSRKKLLKKYGITE